MDIASTIYSAARDNNLNALNELLNSHDVNSENGRGERAFFLAAGVHNDLHTVKLLLKKGVDFRLKDRMVS